MLMGFAHAADAFEVFTLGRTLAGASSGLGACLLSIFLSEISPIHFRGFSGATLAPLNRPADGHLRWMPGAFLEVFLVYGKLTSLVLSLPGLLGNGAAWPWLVALPILPSALILGGLPFLPESPTQIRAKRPKVRRMSSLAN